MVAGLTGIGSRETVSDSRKIPLRQSDSAWLALVFVHLLSEPQYGRIAYIGLFRFDLL